jgi:hypothetical protein
MRAVLEVHLNIQGTRLTKGGEFNLGYNQSGAQFAYDWIKNIKHDTGFRPTAIEKVLFNGNDITDQVKETENRPIPDLPFSW